MGYMDFVSKIVSGNIDRIKRNISNSFVQDLDIQKGFYDELEKGKWNVGDQRFYHGTMHYVAELKPDGSPRWRRVKKNSGGSDNVTNNDSSDKKNDDKNTPSSNDVSNKTLNGNGDSNPSVTDKTLHNTLREMALTGTIRNLKGVSQKRRGEILDELEKRGFIDKHMNVTKSGTAWLSGLKSTQNNDSKTSSDKSSVLKKTSEKSKKDGSQIKSVMNRIKEDFKNGVPMIQKNSKTETSYRVKTIGIKEFGEKLKTDYGKKFAKSFNKFSFKDVDFKNDRDDRYSVHDYFFRERGFDKIEDIADIHADNHKNESDLGLWITKHSIRESFLSKEWDKTKYKIPYNGKNYHFVAETNLFMKKEGDGSYVPKLEYKINLVGVSNSDGTKRIKHVSTLGVCYTKSIDYPYSESKEEESKNFEKLREHYKKAGQRCKDVALYNFVSNFDRYFSKINI
jgi:YHS domain-containing protein